MLIEIKIPMSKKIIDLSEKDFYTWFIDEENKTFSLTKQTLVTSFTSVELLKEKGYTYAN